MTFYMPKEDMKIGKVFNPYNPFLAPYCNCNEGIEISKIARYEGYPLSLPDRWVSFRCSKCKQRIITIHCEKE